MLLPTNSSNNNLSVDQKQSSANKSIGASQKRQLIPAEESAREETDEDYAEDGFENESISAAPGAGKTGNSTLAAQLKEGAVEAAEEAVNDSD